MTVVLITSISRYIGDTADTKPTSCPTGSTFFDRQTGILYITYNGGANWVEKPSDDTVAGLLGGGLPAALGASGGLKVEGVAGGVAQPVSAASGAFASGAIANGADVAQGSTTDTPAIATEDNTARTVVSLLKGVKNTLYVNLLGALGATNGAAVVTDADGTIQQYLRGLVKLLVAKITVGLDSGTNVIGKARLVTATGDEVTEDTGNTVVVSGTVTATANQGTAGAAAWPTSDAGPSWTSLNQVTTSADMTGGADLTAAPTAGQKIVIDDIIFSGDTAMYMSFLEETSGTEKLRLYIPAGGTSQCTTRGKFKLDTADKKLRGDASLAGNVAVTVLYHSEA